MVLPFMTLYVTQALHFTIVQAGIIMSLFGAGAICGGILGGKLTDRFGFYYIQLGALLSGGLMFIVLGQVKNFESICTLSFVLAMLNDAFRPANATAVAQYSKEENRTRSFSLNRLSINLGWAVGGAVGGFIASRNYNLLFWIDGLTNIGAALLLRAVLSPRKNSMTPPKKSRRHKTATSSAYTDKEYLVFVVLTVLFACMFFQHFATLPVFYVQKLHLTPFFIGIVMSLNGLIIALFEMALVFTLEQHKKNIHYITLGMLFVGGAFVLFNLLPGERSLAILATVVVTIGEMLSMPFMNYYWVSRTNDSNRGQYAGLYTVAWSTAQVVGPYLGSQIAEHYSFTVLWWIVGIIAVIAASGFKWLEYRSCKAGQTSKIPPHTSKFE
jgi:predicted MFS family arabinose efflux permease